MEISTLAKSDLKEATEVLVASFKSYEVMQYFFADAGNNYESHIAEFLLFFCQMSLDHNWPCLVIKDNNEIVAIAAGRGIDDNDLVPELEGMNAFCKKIGEAASQRIDTYENSSAAMHSKLPHYFIEILAVHPAHQGKGYAKQLIQDFYTLSQQDPASKGVCLNTESAANVPFYQHLGFQLIAEQRIDTLHSWCFFRPNNQ